MVATEAANEDGTTNTQNGNGVADRINLNNNLVNVCSNANLNEQTTCTVKNYISFGQRFG